MQAGESGSLKVNERYGLPPLPGKKKKTVLKMYYYYEALRHTSIKVNERCGLPPLPGSGIVKSC